MTATWTYVKRATKYEKIAMQQALEAENEFQQQEPVHGWDENGDDCPITFRLENHDGWQMQAYTPSGNMMDGFHESFIRCGNCGEIITYAGDDDTGQYCYECNTELTEYGWRK